MFQKKGLQIYRELGDKEGEWRCLNNLGNILFCKNDENEAIRLYNAGLQIAEETHDHEGVGAICFNLGNLYFGRENYAKKQAYFEKALENAILADDHGVVAGAYFGLGGIAWGDDSNAALDYFTKGLMASRKDGYKAKLVRHLYTFGQFLSGINKTEAAEENLNEGINLAKEVKNDSLVAQGHKYLGQHKFWNSNVNASLTHFNEALSIYKEIDSKSEIYNVLTFILDAEEALSRWDNSLRISDELVLIADELKDNAKRGESRRRLGQAYLRMERNHEAEEQISASLHLFRELGNVPGELNCIHALAMIAAAENLNEKAKKRYSEVIELAEHLGERNILAPVYGNLGHIAISEGDKENSIIYLKKSLALYEEMNDRSGQFRQLRSLADISHPQEALNLRKKALSIIEEIGNEILKGEILLDISSSLIEMEELENAEEFARLSLELSTNSENEVGQSDALAKLGLINKLKDDLTKAVHYFKQCLSLKRKIGDSHTESQILYELADMAEKTGDLGNSERFFRESLEIRYQLNEKLIAAHICERLGKISIERNSLEDANLFFGEGLEIYKEEGDLENQAAMLVNLAITAQSNDDADEQRRFNTKAVQIWRSIGIDVPQWYLDNGY
jgi:tetratricopeptide (TPR) repeat protein